MYLLLGGEPQQSLCFVFWFERERAEAGEFCKRRSLEAQLGIAVKRE